MGFLRRTVYEMYMSMAVAENGLAIDADDLTEECSLGLMNAIDSYDPERKLKFLTYDAPAIRNAMIDFVRAEWAAFSCRMTAPQKENGFALKRVNLDEILPGEDRLLRIEVITDPRAKSPEQIYIQEETLQELYAAMDKLIGREQTYVLYRYGFTDDMEHPLIGAAIHFHLSENRAKLLEDKSMESLRKELP